VSYARSRPGAQVQWIETTELLRREYKRPSCAVGILPGVQVTDWAWRFRTILDGITTGLVFCSDPFFGSCAICSSLVLASHKFINGLIALLHVFVHLCFHTVFLHCQRVSLFGKTWHRTRVTLVQNTRVSIPILSA